MLVGVTTANGIIPWSKYAPSDSNAYTYENFSMSTTSTNQYKITYHTPLFSHRFNYNGIVTMFLQGAYKNRYICHCTGQDENGFNLRFIDTTTHTYVSYETMFQEMSEQYVAISIPCY